MREGKRELQKERMRETYRMRENEENERMKERELKKGRTKSSESYKHTSGRTVNIP